MKNDHEVYKAYFRGYLVYVGEGIAGRNHHLTSGHSHIARANIAFLVNEKIDVQVVFRGTKEECRAMEEDLISKENPLWNSRGAITPLRYFSKVREFKEMVPNKLAAVALLDYILDSRDSGQILLIDKTFFDSRFYHNCRLARYMQMMKNQGDYTLEQIVDSVEKDEYGYKVFLKEEFMINPKGCYNKNRNYNARNKKGRTGKNIYIDNS